MPLPPLATKVKPYASASVPLGKGLMERNPSGVAVVLVVLVVVVLVVLVVVVEVVVGKQASE